MPEMAHGALRILWDETVQANVDELLANPCMCKPQSLWSEWGTQSILVTNAAGAHVPITSQNKKLPIEVGNASMVFFEVSRDSVTLRQTAAAPLASPDVEITEWRRDKVWSKALDVDAPFRELRPPQAHTKASMMRDVVCSLVNREQHVDGCYWWSRPVSVRAQRSSGLSLTSIAASLSTLTSPNSTSTLTLTAASANALRVTHSVPGRGFIIDGYGAHAVPYANAPQAVFDALVARGGKPGGEMGVMLGAKERRKRTRVPTPAPYTQNCAGKRGDYCTGRHKVRVESWWECSFAERYNSLCERLPTEDMATLIWWLCAASHEMSTEEEEKMKTQLMRASTKEEREKAIVDCLHKSDLRKGTERERKSKINGVLMGLMSRETAESYVDVAFEFAARDDDANGSNEEKFHAALKKLRFTTYATGYIPPSLPSFPTGDTDSTEYEKAYVDFMCKSRSWLVKWEDYQTHQTPPLSHEEAADGGGAAGGGGPSLTAAPSRAFGGLKGKGKGGAVWVGSCSSRTFWEGIATTEGPRGDVSFL